MCNIQEMHVDVLIHYQSPTQLVYVVVVNLSQIKEICEHSITIKNESYNVVKYNL